MVRNASERSESAAAEETRYIICCFNGTRLFCMQMISTSRPQIDSVGRPIAAAAAPTALHYVHF